MNAALGMTAPTSVLVSVRGLRVRYAPRGMRAGDVDAVNDVSFDIPRGQTLALVGESGCGKTSVARAVLRLIEPDAGEIRFAGTDVRALGGGALRRLRRRMQIVFQDPSTALNPRMDVAAILAEGMLVHKLAEGAELVTRVRGLLEEVDLDPAKAARYPHELSGGQRQRVAIARALALDPDFLVLDEAVSSLDVTTQARVLDLLAQLQASRGLTCLFIAHNIAVVQRVASSVAVMYLGRIVEHAPADALFAAPQHPYTRALFDAVPVPDPARRRVRTLLAGDAQSDVPAAGCAFHARCPHPGKDSACTAAVPALAAVGDGHVAACVKVRRGAG